MTWAWDLLGRATAVSLAWGALAAHPVSAQDPGDGSLIISGTVCPVDYAGGRFAEECSATPAAGASYQVRNTETGAMRPVEGGFAVADAEGVVAFEGLAGLAPGTIQILAMASDAVAVPGGYTIPAVVCADGEGAIAVEQLDTAFTGLIVELEAQAGDDLRCDVHFVPLSLSGSGESPSTTATPSSEAVAAPAPGRPAAVYAGNCPDGSADPGTPVAALTELVSPDSDTAGQGDAVVAESGFSEIPLSLDQLLGEPHIIGVGSPEEGAPGLVACGVIGGARNEAGHLVIGLREVGDSGFTGIAYLAPGAAPLQTDVSVFVAAGLAGEDAGAGGAPDA